MVKQHFKNFLVFSFIVSSFICKAKAQDHYHMKDIPIQTRWAKEVSPANALPEYPRPQLERTEWQNLNGLWEYAVTDSNVATCNKYDGRILVPYPLESALSGVKKTLLPAQRLWYKRTFKVKTINSKVRTLLNFGAVDYQCWVYVNGKQVGSHTGGYQHFTCDITQAVQQGDNELVLKVYDPTDQGFNPHGKQVLNPAGIMYTPTSGIWQTVWTETVPEEYIRAIKITPDIDKSMVHIVIQSNSSRAVKINVNGKSIKGKSNEELSVPITKPHLWSPEDPYLYGLSVKMGSDEVKSYFGMRKISVAKDENGVDRIFLNNQPYYNLGLLDQGFWPDGLYTAPTDEALKFDIQAEKAMGFNTIRKHIKLEPDRWYYWTDKLGMLVWQDMVNPGNDSPEGRAEFEKENKLNIEQLYNHPSITTWVLFNEGWGAYDQERLSSWMKKEDPSRLLNGHTGSEVVGGKVEDSKPVYEKSINSDMTDIHSYPPPAIPPSMSGKARVLGEFGGIGVFIPKHQWITGSAWGYVKEKPGDMKAKYSGMISKLDSLKQEGLSGSIYTQPYDVEGEQNGLMTYDRKIIKIPLKDFRKIHLKLNPGISKETIPSVKIEDAANTDDQ